MFDIFQKPKNYYYKTIFNLEMEIMELLAFFELVREH